MTSSIFLLGQAAELFLWYNAVFVAIFGVGLLFTLLQVIGLGGESQADAQVDAHVDADVDADLDASADLHADLDHDAELDHATEAHIDAGATSGIASTLAQIFGLGKVPLSISLMVLAYTVGLTGWLSNQALARHIDSPQVFFPLSLLVALVVGFVLLRILSTVMAKYVPTFSTSAMDPRQLVGLPAETVLAVGDEPGLATLHDRYGTLHTVRCCSDNGGIEKGQKVVLVRYLPERNVYIVGRA